MKRHVLTFQMFEQHYADAVGNSGVNDPDPDYWQPTTPSKDEFETVYHDDEYFILQNKKGEYYLWYIDNAERSDYKEYAYVERHYTGKDEDGDPQYDDDDDWEVDGGVVERYINDNLDSIEMGAGFDDFEDGKFAKIDQALFDDVYSLMTGILKKQEEYAQTGETPKNAKGEEIKFFRPYSHNQLRELRERVKKLEEIKKKLNF